VHANPCYTYAVYRRAPAGTLLVLLISSAVFVAPSTATAATFTRPLIQGSTGSDVTALQQILQQQGYLSSSPTGYFGQLTSAALAQFQTAHRPHRDRPAAN
jgi:peptidoglycan hydrolase-like protein with peptidoglycan-binding domain